MGPASASKRALVLAFGVFAYLCFLGLAAAAVSFFGGIGPGRGVDDGPQAPLPLALAIDLGLLALFGVSHSVMARAAFKRRWTKLTGEAAERSVYVLVASAILALTFWQWRAIPHVLWRVPTPAGRAAIVALELLGVLLVIASSFLTDHFDLFGLRQVWLYARGRDYTPVPFKQHVLYRVVRHPMMLGFVITFWAAPTMSVGRALFAAGMSAYVAIGIAFEERDLARRLGEDYRLYRRQVPAIIPSLAPLFRSATGSPGPRRRGSRTAPR
jgi:protein-S-isoprenylcysteine O-methyltransferase Ste14